MSHPMTPLAVDQLAAALRRVRDTITGLDVRIRVGVVAVVALAAVLYIATRLAILTAQAWHDYAATPVWDALHGDRDAFTVVIGAILAALAFVVFTRWGLGAAAHAIEAARGDDGYRNHARAAAGVAASGGSAVPPPTQQQ